MTPFHSECRKSLVYYNIFIGIISLVEYSVDK